MFITCILLKNVFNHKMLITARQVEVESIDHMGDTEENQQPSWFQRKKKIFDR